MLPPFFINKKGKILFENSLDLLNKTTDAYSAGAIDIKQFNDICEAL